MINFIYGFISNPSLQSLVSFLNVLTIFLITFGTGFLLLFIIMIYRPGFMSTIKSQILFLILYGTILIGIFFIPNGSEVRILKDGTQLSPVWNYPFTLYISIHLTSSLLILLILSFKTYKKFENEILARRLKYFDIGILIYYYIALGAAINNFLDIPIFRIIYAISSLITFAGVLFLYYSIGTNVNIPFPTNHSKF